MTNERAKDVLDTFFEDLKKKLPEKTSENTTVIEALEVAISALEQVTKVQNLLEYGYLSCVHHDFRAWKFMIDLENIVGGIERIKKELTPCSVCRYKDDDAYVYEVCPAMPMESGKCKNCKYFEYDSVAKVDGIPLIVAHEICNKWGDGCKTNEDGYCFLFEPQERSEE